MKKKKRVVAILLSLLLMFSLCSNVTYAEENINTSEDTISEVETVEETDDEITVDTTTDETEDVSEDESTQTDDTTTVDETDESTDTVDDTDDEVITTDEATVTVSAASFNSSISTASTDDGISLTAEDETTDAVAQIGETTYASVTEAIAAVTDSTETTITMVANSTEDITISSSQSIILDLNGNTLTGTGTGSVVTNSGTLTIKDSSGDNSGTITGGSATNGGGIYNNGSLMISEGTISGNNATSTGGGVWSNGSFELLGGIISENSAASSGGGLYVSGTKSITGGSITNNTSGNLGGGLYASGEITIIGTESNLVIISGNSAAKGGGGAYISSSYTVSMSYLKISDNTVTGTQTSAQSYYYAAGLTIIGNRTSAGYTVTLTNVEISNNSSLTELTGGLGIYASWFTATNCEITGNTSSSGVGGVHTYTSNPSLGSTSQKVYSYNFNSCLISNNIGGTIGGLYVERYSTATTFYANAVLTDTVITNNTGVTAGGVSGPINMTSGALYGNASTDGYAANDWLVTKSVVTASNFNVSVLQASSMSDGNVSFDNCLWIDVINGLTLDSVLSKTTLSNESATTFYFTARELSYVAEITIDGNPTQYETITAAIEAAMEMDDDVTITLIAGEDSGYTITEDVIIPEGENITIDLNGCTINNKSASYAITISSGASLTLNGTGSVNGIDDQGTSLNIMGNIEIGKVKLATDAVITASNEFNPKSLTIVLDNDVLNDLNDYSDISDIVTLVEPADDEEIAEALVNVITISGTNILVTVYQDDDGSIVAAITTELNGIFVDGVDGNDETGNGTYNKPVKTFAKAKELLEEALTAEEECDGIYVINTITVTDTEEWNLDDLTDTAGEVSLMRFPTFTGVLVTVGDNGNLTLSDITIDGQNITVTSSLVQVNGNDAKLIINDGTVIQNNINNTSGAISETEAAVTVVNGTLTMNGGTITGNTGTGVVELL